MMYHLRDRLDHMRALRRVSVPIARRRRLVTQSVRIRLSPRPSIVLARVTRHRVADHEVRRDRRTSVRSVTSMISPNLPRLDRSPSTGVLRKIGVARAELSATSGTVPALPRTSRRAPRER